MLRMTLPCRPAARLLTLALATTSPLLGQDVLTYHNDIHRSGLDAGELALSPDSVSNATFGLRFNLATDGKVDAQPLYAGAVTVGPNGARSNLLIVATEHDTVYAFDADTGAVRWQRSLLLASETPSDDRGCSQVTPEIGVTATPVIERLNNGTGRIFVVAMSKSSGNPIYHQRLHVLDLATGAERSGSPVNIAADYPGTGPGNNGAGRVIFNPAQYKERPGLALVRNSVITSWSSHCDFAPYTGWIIVYDKNTLAQTSILNVDPNGVPSSSFLEDGSGNAFWNSGAAPAADGAGFVYMLDSNGPFDTNLVNGFPRTGDYGDAFLKLSTQGGVRVLDYFTPYDQAQQAAKDEDLGSGGVLLFPKATDAQGRTRWLAVGAGKDGKIYIVDRTRLGKINLSSANNSNLYQEVPNALQGPSFGAPAYFNGGLYYGPVGTPLRRFAFQNARLVATPTSVTAASFGYPGTTPSISSYGNSRGIVWAHENASNAVLHAYDAADLTHELYTSAANPGRDSFGAGNKFIVPTVANGKVFVGTTRSVGVFGLLNATGAAPAAAAVAPATRMETGALRYDEDSGLYVGTVAVTNVGAETISGPLSLALDELTPTATLANADGATTAGGASPYVTVQDDGLRQGEKRTFYLRVAAPERTTVTYRPRLLHGFGPR